MKELNATSINFFKNQIVLSGKFKENLNFTLTLNDDESLFEIFENNFLIETHLIDKDNYSPTLQHDLTDGTATIIFADYSFTFPEALLYPNRVEKRKQILSYIYKFNKKIEFINNNAQKDSNAKYKSFQELPEILKAVICSELNSGEMIPNEIFVNTKYDELKNQTILEAMNTLIESHSEEKATSIIRQKILENPFAY